MTSRRVFLAGAVTTLAAPLAAEAQVAGRVPRVGILVTTSSLDEIAGPEPRHPHIRAFLRALRDLGYVDGQNLITERRSAEGKWDRLPELAAEIVRLGAEVVVVPSGTVARRVREVTTSVPIVVVAGGEFVRQGLVSSLAKPGGNVTGLTSDVSPGLEAKRLELLKDVLPSLSRVGVLFPAPERWSPTSLATAQREIRAAAHALALQVLSREIAARDAVDAAFASLRKDRAEAVMVVPDTLAYAERYRYVESAARHRLPTIYEAPEFVEVGGLVSYGVSYLDLFRRAAGYVDKILKGAKPADLPVEQPTKFELVINLKTAKQMGLTIPQSVLFRADKVIR
jgi:putative tryptophan/tyrosine transport system substrate-binding protein